MMQWEAFCTIGKMRIRAKKIVRGSYLSMAFVFLLLIGVESKLEEQEAVIAYLIDSGEINHEMVHSSYSFFQFDFDFFVLCVCVCGGLCNEGTV